MEQSQQERAESLGPAERIINALINNVDHMVHNRPGIVVNDNRSLVGVTWKPVTHKIENGHRVCYELQKAGRKTNKVRLGVIGDDNQVRNATGRVIGEYRAPGIFPEVATYLYSQVAEIWKMDNEFVARWASWAMKEEYRDLKVILAAFSLVQSRCGEPIREDGELLFYDEDYREVGEAMCLIRMKGNRDINPKLLLRIGDVLCLDSIADINRELGFGRSAKNPALGRWKKTVSKWLLYRENNVPMLQGLVRAGYRKTVIALSQRVGYKPQSAQFFQILRWKQKQAPDGRRQIAIGEDVRAAEDWSDLTEAQICQKIVSEKPNFKRITGLLPARIGLTRAVMSASIEAGSLSDNDLIIMTPTLEQLGLLDIQSIRDRWQQATMKAENQRAANIARRVRKAENVEALQAASDAAAKKALEEVMNDIRVYFIVDKSGSMDGAIEKAKTYLAQILQGFPLEKLHVSIFNTTGRVVNIRHSSAAGVTAAFRGHKAGGGTNYSSGVKALENFKPAPNEDAVMIFVGDQADSGHQNFAPTVRNSGINPVAFGMLNVIGRWGTRGNAVENTARILGIPCFEIQEDTFADPYAVTRTFRNLIASTPVGVGAARGNRKTLVEKILETDLLTKPSWA